MVAFAYNELLNINNITSEFKYTGIKSINQSVFNANDFVAPHIAETTMTILTI